VTLQDLIAEVGRDATRYFLVARAANSQLTFDIDLAISQSNDNPVYYIQYAHARICSMMRKLAENDWNWSKENTDTLEQLNEDGEKRLMNKLAAYPELIGKAGKNCEPYIVANYLQELAGDFHSYYNSHKMLIEDTGLRNARLSLCEAVRQVLNNGLALLGVSAPESM
jgi:arginyl-tRNA synthetase